MPLDQSSPFSFSGFPLSSGNASATSLHETRSSTDSPSLDTINFSNLNFVQSTDVPSHQVTRSSSQGYTDEESWSNCLSTSSDVMVPSGYDSNYPAIAETGENNVLFTSLYLLLFFSIFQRLSMKVK